MTNLRLRIGSRAACERRLADEATAHRQRDPLAPLPSLVGRTLLRPHLRRRLAELTGGHLNVRFITVGELGLRLGQAELLATGRRLLPFLADRILAQQVARASTRWPGDPAVRASVKAEVDDVIDTEGPVEAMRLARLVCRRFDLQRVAHKRSADVIALIDSEQLDATEFGTFPWPTHRTRAFADDFRVPGEDDEARVLPEVCPQELIGAMRFLARTGGGIDLEELVRETALIFGTRRLTAKPRAHLEAVAGHAVQRGELVLDGESLTCGPDVTV